jgi:hypothetical protein
MFYKLMDMKKALPGKRKAFFTGMNILPLFLARQVFDLVVRQDRFLEYISPSLGRADHLDEFRVLLSLGLQGCDNFLCHDA